MFCLSCFGCEEGGPKEPAGQTTEQATVEEHSPSPVIQSYPGALELVEFKKIIRPIKERETSLIIESPPKESPEATSSRRRSCSGGIQRQASICLSDEEIEEGSSSKPSSVVATEWTELIKSKHGSADSVNAPTVISPDWEQEGTPPRDQTIVEAVSTVSEVVQLEDYHYSRQHALDLVSRGASLLHERSVSSSDVTGDTERWLELPPPLRQASSTEGGLLEEMLESERKNIKSRVWHRDEESPKLKFRYNDTGSREELLETSPGLSPSDSGETEGVSEVTDSDQMRQQYRQLWELRATLEGEEELSDTLRADDDEEEDDEVTSPVKSGAQSHTTSLESAGDDPPDVSVEEGEMEGEEVTNHWLQLPSHESRRRSYKNLLTRRIQKRTDGSTETSADTEESSTDASRATTSVESATDSAGEGQNHKLQQMKADSGYKSMESTVKPPKHLFPQSGDSQDILDSQMSQDSAVSFRLSEDLSQSVELYTPQPEKEIGVPHVTTAESQMETPMEAKRGRFALRKRRHYGAVGSGKRDIILTEAVQTIDHRPPLAELHGTKTSLLQRLFPMRSERTRYDRLLYRDYTIDEKSDTLFREFSLPDPSYETDPYRIRASRTSRIYSHRSPDGGSPRVLRKVLSPQLSIEEEDSESDPEKIFTSSEIPAIRFSEQKTE
ncbi:uncharacterized protein LOC111621692 isoform X4 [Centruroides sculpturatus]|uniref:uncharacterized protein LOC111621692 isoform X4 n=1 Tax=Centruroides sculpturatus TaxID=218467 RepID=UPI000C6D2D69|nr:uncharacterized protein LOC111621692 isoform X4 [Centruroides sculpturatus]